MLLRLCMSLKEKSVRARAAEGMQRERVCICKSVVRWMIAEHSCFYYQDDPSLSLPSSLYPPSHYPAPLLLCDMNTHWIVPGIWWHSQWVFPCTTIFVWTSSPLWLCINTLSVLVLCVFVSMCPQLCKVPGKISGTFQNIQCVYARDLVHTSCLSLCVGGLLLVVFRKVRGHKNWWELVALEGVSSRGFWAQEISSFIRNCFITKMVCT